ncbi:hypothetical protein CPB85DRAFT_1439816 [Mucidula mucida]|nr:hypothetical protein CPB85DRAFT_1439816 [Mucidula mucida]
MSKKAVPLSSTKPDALCKPDALVVLATDYSHETKPGTTERLKGKKYAMKAAQAAFTLARILHHDISVGNIMITPKDRGVLINGDLCLVLDSNVVTHCPGRTGTWQFVSVHLLNGRLPHGGDTGKQSITHSLVDNRESAFWVLLYIALLHLKHKSPPTDLHNKLIKWFDFNTVDDYHRDTGGDEKLNCLRGWANYVRTHVNLGIPGLNVLFTKLAQVFMYRYRGFEDSDPKVEALKASYLWTVAEDGPDSVHVRTTPYGQYVLGGQHMESASWLYDTLRQYATDMPTPVQPAAVKNPERSACCAVSVIYDFVKTDEVLRGNVHRLSAAWLGRALFYELPGLNSGFTGIESHLNDLDKEEDDEEEPQRKRVKTKN